jgi:hypothetical protein
MGTRIDMSGKATNQELARDLRAFIESGEGNAARHNW